MRSQTIAKYNRLSKYIFIFWSLNLFFIITFSLAHFDNSFFRSQLYFLLQPSFFLALVLRIPWAYNQYLIHKNPLSKDPYFLGS